MHYGESHAELMEAPEAQLVRKSAQLVVEPGVHHGLVAAVPVHGLLPVCHRMQHVDRLIALGRQDGELRDHKRPWLCREPVLDRRSVHLERKRG